MKAALVNNENVVENVIVWDENSQEIPGFTNVVVEDDVSVSIGFKYDPATNTFVDTRDPDEWKKGLSNYELRRLTYPPISELADAVYWQQQGDNTKMEAYLAKVEEVKAKYPL